jgi:hypothetical protein
LYTVPYVQLYEVAQMIASRGGSADVLQELLIAGQCDLLVREMVEDSADYAELPPIDEDNRHGRVARELLIWGFQGIPPHRYRHLSRPGRLYSRANRRRVADVVDELRLEDRCSELTKYARALSALVSQER